MKKFICLCLFAGLLYADDYSYGKYSGDKIDTTTVKEIDRLKGNFEIGFSTWARSDAWSPTIILYSTGLARVYVLEVTTIAGNGGEIFIIKESNFSKLVTISSGLIINPENTTFQGRLQIGSSIAAGKNSIAFGGLCETKSNGSFAGGSNAIASGGQSFAFGRNLEATAPASMVMGIGIGSGAFPLVNDKGSSFMIGFESEIPSFYVASGPRDGRPGTTGIVSISSAPLVFPTVDGLKFYVYGNSYVNGKSSATYLYGDGRFLTNVGTGSAAGFATEIAVLFSSVTINSNAIAVLESSVTINTNAIAVHSGSITINTDDIATNADDITTNIASIKASTTSAISDLVKSSTTWTGQNTFSNTVRVSSNIKGNYSGPFVIEGTDSTIELKAPDEITLIAGNDPACTAQPGRLFMDGYLDMNNKKISNIDWASSDRDFEGSALTNISTAPSAGYATAKEYVDYAIWNATDSVDAILLGGLADTDFIKKDGSVAFAGTINTNNQWISGDGDISEGIQIDDAGDVGIGVSNAFVKLVVKGNEATSGNGTFIRVSNYSNTEGTLSGLQFKSADSGTDGYVKAGIFFIRGTATGRDYLHFSIQGVTGADNVDPISDASITIKYNKFVGINDTTPSYQLDVNGTFRVTGASQFNNALTVGNTVYAEGFVVQTKPLPKTSSKNSIMAMKNKADGSIDYGSFGDAMVVHRQIKTNAVVDSSGTIISPAIWEDKKGIDLQAVQNKLIKALQEAFEEIAILKAWKEAQ